MLLSQSHRINNIHAVLHQMLHSSAEFGLPIREMPSRDPPPIRVSTASPGRSQDAPGRIADGGQ